MNRRNAIAVIAFGTRAAADIDQDTIRKTFVGVWRIVSCESKDRITGKVRFPYGTNPVGRLTYDSTGRMSAQVMRPGRRSTIALTAPASAIGDILANEMREAVVGYMAYFGTFDIDVSTRTVIHHVDASLVPSWVGTDQRRTYDFSGQNRLTLTASRPETVNTLVWRRES